MAESDARVRSADLEGARRAAQQREARALTKTGTRAGRRSRPHPFKAIGVLLARMGGSLRGASAIEGRV